MHSYSRFFLSVFSFSLIGLFSQGEATSTVLSQDASTHHFRGCKCRNSESGDSESGDSESDGHRLPTPVITHIEPNRGTIEGGTTVHIRGHNFDVNALVFFGGYIADYITLSSDEIIAIAPPHKKSWIYVQVVTQHGATPTTRESKYTYVNQ